MMRYSTRIISIFILYIYCLKSNTPLELQSVAAAEQKIVEITKTAVNKTAEPGWKEKVQKLYQEISSVDASYAREKFSGLIDKLFALPDSFSSAPSVPTISTVPSKENTPGQSASETVNTTQEEQQLGQRLAQTIDSIKQAATQASGSLQKNAQAMCDELKVIDFKATSEAISGKAAEATTACAQLAQKITEQTTAAAATVSKQVSGMVEEIKKNVKEGSQKAKETTAQLCATVQQGVASFGSTVKEQWAKVETQCAPLLSAFVPKQLEPKRITSATDNEKAKAGLKTESKEFPAAGGWLFDQPNASSASTPSSSGSTVSGTNPFNSTTASGAKTGSNPFTSPQPTPLGQNPFTQPPLGNPFTQGSAANPTLTDLPKKIAEQATKKPGPEVKKAVEKENPQAVAKLATQLAVLLEDLQTEYPTIQLTATVQRYHESAVYEKRFEEIVRVYATLSSDHRKTVENLLKESFKQWVTNIQKQYTQTIECVGQLMSLRSQYVALWLGLETEQKCSTSTIKTESFSFTGLFEQAKQFICTDDELLFAQKGKQKEAIVKKEQVEKMLKELTECVQYIEQGIIAPFNSLRKKELHEWTKEGVKALQEKSKSLLWISSQAVIDTDTKIKGSIETFYKGCGALILCYSLWVRFLDAFGKEQDASSFKKNYFTPLYELLEQLAPLSLQETEWEKLLKEGKQFRIKEKGK